MGFFNVSDAMALGLIEGADMAFERIRVEDKEQLEKDRVKAEKAALAAAGIQSKYDANDRIDEQNARVLSKSVALQNTLKEIKLSNPELYEGVPDINLYKALSKRFRRFHSDNPDDNITKYGQRATRRLNNHLLNNSPNSILEEVARKFKADKEIKPTTDDQQMSALNLMTREGKRRQQEQELRPTNLGPEAMQAYDEARLGKPVEFKPEVLDPLVDRAAKTPNRQVRGDQESALIASITGTIPERDPKDPFIVRYPSGLKSGTLMKDVQNSEKLLKDLAVEFNGYMSRFASLYNTSDLASIKQAADDFKNTLVDPETFTIRQDVKDKLTVQDIQNARQNANVGPIATVVTPKSPTKTGNVVKKKTDDKKLTSEGKLLKKDEVPDEVLKRLAQAMKEARATGEKDSRGKIVVGNDVYEYILGQGIPKVYKLENTQTEGST